MTQVTDKNDWVYRPLQSVFSNVEKSRDWFASVPPKERALLTSRSSVRAMAATIETADKAFDGVSEHIFRRAILASVSARGFFENWGKPDIKNWIGSTRFDPEYASWTSSVEAALGACRTSIYSFTEPEYAAHSMVLASNTANTAIRANGGNLPKSEKDRFVQEQLRDIEYQEDPFPRIDADDLEPSPLWREGFPSPRIFQRHCEFANKIRKNGHINSFLLDWYLRVWYGHKVDWILVDRVIKIRPEVWFGDRSELDAEISEIVGADKVNDVDIRVRSRIKRLNPEATSLDVYEYLLTSCVTPDEANSQNPIVGHNGPPKQPQIPIDSIQIDHLMQLVVSLMSQLRNEKANISQLKVLLTDIEDAEKGLRERLSKRVGLSADEFSKQFGKLGAAAVWGGFGTITLWAIGLLEKLGPLIDGLNTLVSSLLS